MSGVNNITLSYQEYKSYVKNNKNSKLVNRSYSMEMSGSTDSEGKLIGNTVYTDIGTGVTYEMKAAYDNNFTSDTPLIKVTAKDTNGRQQAYLVNIDEVDVSDASDIELFALCSYADAHEKRTEGSKSSWDLLKGYVKENALDEGYDQKRDWLTMVENAKDECMEAKLYKQVTDGNKLTQLLEKYGMPKEVEMIRIDDNTLVPVENGIFVQDVDGGYAQMLFDKSGEIRYVNNLNKNAGWSMEVSQEMLKKAQELGSEYALYMSVQTFWERYLNSDMTIEELKAATDYKVLNS